MSKNSTPGVSGQDNADPPRPSIPTTDPLEGLCRLAIRDDGRLLLSLDDVADRDLTGRDVRQYVLLTEEESVRAMGRVTDALVYVAARAANELPKLMKGKP